ncbi:MAG: hypothetical protein DCO96_03475 [Fluviicola sp. XM-24bin1]|nr:MAG: hypothetical protein DCO96_03475 [Fluviicola sp. XM-24bin1]
MFFMKYLNLTLLVLSLLVVTPLISQVDSLQIDGKYYKVYPIRQRMEITEEYWIAVDDEAYFQDEENYFKVFGEGDAWFTRAAFDTSDAIDQAFLREELEERWNDLTKKRKYFRGKFVKAVRKNPTSLLDPHISNDTDVLPAFSALPDGDYVQLFTDFCYLNEDGTCQEQAPRVAAYFSMKNNLLDGPALWINTKGDTLRYGQYKNGLRTGTWKFTQIGTYSYYFYSWEAKYFAKYGARPMDTSFITKTYQAGELDGPYEYRTPSGWSRSTGFYKNGEPAGNWRTYRYDTLTSNLTYANPSDTTVSHKPILRTSMPLEDYIEWNVAYDFTSAVYPRLSIPQILKFDFGNDIERELELEEEGFQSHTLEYDRYGYDYGEGPIYYDEYGLPINKYPERVNERLNANLPGYRRAQSGLFSLIDDPNNDTTETRGYFIDSLGATMLYQGTYETFYPNGQLFTRYEFQNGELVEEGPLYWDNGQVWDAIEFVPDSNHYLRTVYDYNGLKTNVAIYDSLGDFLRYDVEEEVREVDELHIDGLVAEKEGLRGEFYYGYRSRDSHKKLRTLFTGNYTYQNPIVVADSIIPDTSFIMYREYNGFDKKTKTRDITFDPATRTYVHNNISFTGVNYTNTSRTFTENYNGWTGKSTWKYGKFTVIETSSGIWREDPLDPEEDTVIHMGRIMYPYDGYYVTTDVEILKDGVPYTGKVVLKNRSMFNRTSKNKLVTRQQLYTNSKKSGKRLYRYLKSSKKHPSLDLMSGPSEFDYIASSIAYNLFQTANSRLFNGFRPKNYYGWGAGGKPVRKVKGQYLEGKPQGYWCGKRFGKLTSEIQYDLGEEFGTYKSYELEYRSSKWDRLMADDTLSKKKVHYLDITIEFDKGRRQGEFRNYNWVGDIEGQGTFKDDFEEGEFIRRDPRAYSVSQYKNGYLDGYAQTYLTFPGMDTVLLYDLNFQDGALNGESNTYHINGKLAKRGFFLNGEPIDDYEAFDTLGFKYHYVKFQYGFPIEEKIWEENELSLRYQFDWKDSIPFDPSDLMQSQSLDRLLYDYGYNDYGLQQAYYGRDRLVNKDGLEYHMTKFYPNDTIARIGRIDNGEKIGLWKFYDYDGLYLYKVDYFDSIIEINDSIRFKSKGVLTSFNAQGDSIFRAHIIEKMEKYDCAHTDHYEIRQLYTIWETPDSTNRMNGYVRNYYDNGVLQNEGYMKDGLPTGLWKYYDPFGKLNLMGTFEQGKRNGRWLQGDLEKKKYLGEICLNPNLPNLEKEKKYRENLLDVTIINYKLGKTVSKQFFDLNLNKYSDMIDD